MPKNDLGVWDTFTDTRTWTLDDVSRHAPLARRIVESGHASILAHLAPGASPIELERKLDEAIAKAPPSQRAPADLSHSAVAAADAAKKLASDAWDDFNR